MDIWNVFHVYQSQIKNHPVRFLFARYVYGENRISCTVLSKMYLIVCLQGHLKLLIYFMFYEENCLKIIFVLYFLKNKEIDMRSWYVLQRSLHTTQLAQYLLICINIYIYIQINVYVIYIYIYNVMKLIYFIQNLANISKFIYTIIIIV